MRKGSCRYPPVLKKILASARPAFSEFEGPLFEGASVTVKTNKSPEGRLIPDPSTAKLVLPKISAKESAMVSESFDLTVRKEFEDDKAQVKAYAFTFKVSDVRFSPTGDGLVQPQFTQSLKEFKHVS